MTMSKYSVAAYHKDKAIKCERVLARLYSVSELLGRCPATAEIHQEFLHTWELIQKWKAIEAAHWAIVRQLLDRFPLRRSEQLSKQARHAGRS